MKKTWFYVLAERFLLFKIDGREDDYVVRSLPMNVGGPNTVNRWTPNIQKC